jgi:hypothetical protein
MSSSAYNIIDDGNGNLVDAAASNVHVGNLLYNQGIGIITNVDYLYALTPTPPCTVPTFKPFNVDSSSVIANWDSPGNPTLYYEYVVSTSSISPVGSGTDVLANSGTITVTGLSSSTTYYFFLRSRCSVSSYSNWVKEEFTTTIAAVPLRTGLIGEYYSSVGVVTSSNDVTSWYDQSGYGNDLYVVAPTNNLWFPQYSASYYNTQPGIYFSGSSATGSSMRTAVTMSGLSGSQQLTVYYVVRPLAGSDLIMEYASGSSIGTNGSYETSTGSFYLSATSTTMGAGANGNVGLTNGSKLLVNNAKQVLTNVIDFSQLTNEVTVYVNNDSTGITRIQNNNNSESFEGYKLTVGGGATDYRWQTAKAIIGSILIYNVTHSNAERLQVYNYLSSSYLV